LVFKALRKGESSISTSLLYHGWGIRGYVYRHTKHVAGGTEFHIEQKKDFQCAACGSRRVIGRGRVVRRLRAPSIGFKPVTLVIPVQRVECKECGALRQVELDFADERRSYTKAFERYALELSRMSTIQAAAAHLNVSWDVVKDIQKRYYKRKFGKPELRHLRWLSIDEICIGSGHRYWTVVMDLESGAVVFVGEGKDAGALLPFWKRLKRAGARIEAVAMDMGPAYIAAVQEHLPAAQIVFDHFHVIKLFNDKLSQLRRDVHREAVGGLHKNVLKGTRWLLLKNPENLNPLKDERRRLDEALKLNQPLATAYYMKEDLRRFWSQPDKAVAGKFLEDWLSRATASGIQMLKKMANTLGRMRSGLLAYYDFKISSGKLEGFNNKIKTMQRQACGYRDQEFFKLKILALHTVKYALIG
jgi:transposase